MTTPDPDARFHAFLIVSEALTGYNSAELHGTGCADEYWHQFGQVVPETVLDKFLMHAEALKTGNRDNLVRSEYLSDQCLGPVARSLIQLWYLGQWVPLPPVWCDAFGASSFDVAQIISARSYKEGLVWDAIGAHPMGAKQQGFGAWALDPPSGRIDR